MFLVRIIADTKSFRWMPMFLLGPAYQWQGYSNPVTAPLET